MRVLKLIIGLCLSISFSCKSQEQNVRVLEVNNSQVFKLLNEVIKYEKSDTAKNKIYVIKTIENSSNYELRVANFSKSLFSRYILGKKDPLLGFFNYEGYCVLVYGKSIPPALFQKTKMVNSFNFLSKRSNGLKQIEKENDVLEPPYIIEPNVWLYDYVNKIIAFKEVGYFNLLK